MGSALSFTVEWFPWCGLLIDTTNLQILVDNSRYKNIRDCLTISNSSIVPAHSLSIQLIQALLLKCVPHLLDSKFLSDGMVLCNLYLNFTLSAIKFHCYIKYCIKAHGLQSNSRATASEIMRMLMSSTRQFDHRARSICKRAVGVYSVPLTVCNWLSLKSFHTVFKRKKSLYGPLLFLMKNALQRMQESMDETIIDLLLETVDRCSNDPVLSIIY